MNDSANNPTTSNSSQISVIFIVVFIYISSVVIAAIIGYKTHEGVVKGHADDFGKIKLQDYIYKVEVIKSPYKPIDLFMGKELEEEGDER